MTIPDNSEADSPVQIWMMSVPPDEKIYEKRLI